MLDDTASGADIWEDAAPLRSNNHVPRRVPALHIACPHARNTAKFVLRQTIWDALMWAEAN